MEDGGMHDSSPRDMKQFYMSNQNQRPTLQGQKIKTRKRDEKEKYDPSAFRDAILLGIDETNGDLELVSKFLDKAGSQVDYRRYAETLLDILFAGGILDFMEVRQKYFDVPDLKTLFKDVDPSQIFAFLKEIAPGGFILQEPEKELCKTDTCVLRAKGDFESHKAYYEVFHKLIRRYKYIEKSFDAELKKLLLFSKGFSVEERKNLATSYGICIGNGLGNANCVEVLFQEHLVKDGISIEFATNMFASWLKEKDMTNLNSTLKKAGLEGQLMRLLPINKRTIENFNGHFSAAGLQQIVEYQKVKASADLKKSVQKKLTEMIEEEEPVKEMIVTVKEEMEKVGLAEHEVIVMAWNTVMNANEWSKKDDLVAEQALKHLRTYMPLFSSMCNTGRSQLALIIRMQDYSYENIVFMKAFQKMVIFFYKGDLLSEEVILKWYREAHSQKGKSVFLEQMKKFVEWLENAEEESEEEDED